MMEPESWKSLVDVGCSQDCIEQYKRLADDEQRFLYLRQYRRCCWIRFTTSRSSWTARLLTASVKKGRLIMNLLIVYYSWSNGNTQKIAEQLRLATGADIARIETVKPYEGSYMNVVNQGQREVNEAINRTSDP